MNRELRSQLALCVKLDGDTNLTLNKLYVVKRLTPEFVYVIDDNGQEVGKFRYKFKFLPNTEATRVLYEQS